MNILAIDCSTPKVSVCLVGEKERYSRKSAPEAGGAQNLLGLVDAVCRQAKITKFTKNDCLVLSAGPGSFTSLRIGYALAKGLCFASKARLFAIPSLRAYAQGLATGSETSIVSLVPARGIGAEAKYYFSQFQQGEESVATQEGNLGHINALANNLKKIIFTGPGALELVTSYPEREGLIDVAVQNQTFVWAERLADFFMLALRKTGGIFNQLGEIGLDAEPHYTS